MSQQKIRTGFVGAGYISRWHAAALRKLDNVVVTAICDRSAAAAQSLADELGVQAFGSVSDLVASDVCDAVHILTPPDTHGPLALECLDAGLHVWLEKPMATSSADCAAIVERAEQQQLVVGVGHNFLGLPSYLRLKELIGSGSLGRTSSIDINWCYPMQPLRSGPFGLWFLQSPRNLLLELGPHLYAFACDLFGELDNFSVRVGKPIEIPGVGTQYQSWLMLARAGDVDVRLQLSLVETMDDRSVVVHGSSARARLDYAKDTLVIDRSSASDIVVGPLLDEVSVAKQRLWNGTVNAARQTISLNQKSPYGLGFIESASSFYSAISAGKAIDDRFSAASGSKVIAAIEQTLNTKFDVAAAGSETPNKAAAKKPCEKRLAKGTGGADEAIAMVIGGTGFLGRDLVRGLVERGKRVRVVSRSGADLFAKYGDRVETAVVSLKDRQGLSAAMQGVDVVFNLARSVETSWEACLENDVAPSIAVAEAAKAADVRRLIYTGTIASYDMSSSDKYITEDTEFGQDLTRRNLYARSKATCEHELQRISAESGLDLVIVRPGIVVGPGGPLQHWGIGRWHGAGAVRVWGNGRNKLPFVLVRDVTEGLILTSEVEAAAGHSFNLVGDPLLSAREYFNAIETELGVKIDVKPSWLIGMYVSGTMKTFLKKNVLQQRGLYAPSLADWESRAHLSVFDNQRPKAILGWQPENDRNAFIHEAISNSQLFGF